MRTRLDIARRSSAISSVSGEKFGNSLPGFGPVHLWRAPHRAGKSVAFDRDGRILGGLWLFARLALEPIFSKPSRKLATPNRLPSRPPPFRKSSLGMI